jgi:tetratricopeptide (TPR) repeat protein
MAAPRTGPQRYYKIKHSSGRVLGPLDLARVRKLILKNQLRGGEVARVYPDGDWVELTQIPEIFEMLLAQAGGQLRDEPEEKSGDAQAEVSSPGPTVISSKDSTRQVVPSLEPSEDDSPTMVRTRVVSGALSQDLQEATAIAKVVPHAFSPEQRMSDQKSFSSEAQIAREDTVVLVRPGSEESSSPQIAPKQTQKGGLVFQSDPARGVPKKQKPSTLRKLGLIGVALVVALELFIPDETPKKSKPIGFEPFRPKPVVYVEGKSDPQESAKLYAKAIAYFLKDTVLGYREASNLLLQSAALDKDNAKAFALLASSYLNLIDASNKDESFFSVITQILEAARAKGDGLQEVVMADVEFYITINKPEAAENRIVEYTKIHARPDPALYFYLAYAFSARGDYAAAARHLSRIPDNIVFSPRVFYLRGLVAEKQGDLETAEREYQKALQKEKDHARSRLRLVEIAYKKGTIVSAADHLQILTADPRSIPPKEMALAYFLSSKLHLAFKKYNEALEDIERASKLDRENHDYIVELFSLRTKVGADVQSVQKDARMYFFLSEAEKLTKQGKYQDALLKLLDARQANPNSPLPSSKIGDLFMYLNDVTNSREAYEKAAKMAPDDVGVWSKYIKTLILSFEWDEAEKAMARFRTLPVGQSVVDKAAGDMYSRQGRHVEAQHYYKSAMRREAIDKEVYLAYAKSLLATKNYKEAPFFFSLALRFDPLNTDAVIGIAKSIANSEGLERGISHLQDELQKLAEPRAELLAAIAELHVQRGDWDAAQSFVDQAVAANPDYALPYKLQAQIYLNKEGVEKNAVDLALRALNSFSERNRSDATGYLERYRILLKRKEFQAALDELSRVYSVYPRYPNLHYYRGQLYGIMGNHRVAIAEFREELKNNPKSVPTLVELGKSILETRQGNQDAAVIKEAADLFTKAMQLAPTASEPRHQAGYAAYLQKNYQAAVALFQSAAALDKGNPEIFKRMGQAYREMGDASSARASFKRYLDLSPDAPDRAEISRFL